MTTVPHNNTEETPMDVAAAANNNNKEKKKKPPPANLVIPPKKPPLTKAERRAVQEAQRAAKKGPTTREQQLQYVDYLCILDFEATCNREGPVPEPQEIIEFPTLMLNIATQQVESSTFHHYILPHVHPTVSEFCTELTGITQEMVDNGISLQEALRLHQEWLDENGLVSLSSSSLGPAAAAGQQARRRFLYVTGGDWDLKTCLPNQLNYHGGIPTPLGFKAWIDVKKAYGEVFQVSNKKRGMGMISMLSKLGLELEGRHHSGIDDCKNIARICVKLLEKGWIPKATTTTTEQTATTLD